VTHSFVFRDLLDMARHFEQQARQYQVGRPRSKIDEAFRKGNASALFSVADTIRHSKLEPDTPPEAA
jgi:hypothetical protein